MTRNWFDQGGSAYAAYRPDYPSELGPALAALAPWSGTAVDVGCGTGQLTGLLAGSFDTVIGVDPSADQPAQAAARENVDCRQGDAEALPVADRTADLIAAAQAAHWFDLPAFYREVRRIAAPGAVLALVSYGVMVVEPDLQERFDRFYWQEIGPFWPPQRRTVESGYQDIEFPFPELATPSPNIRRDWTLEQCLGYLSTWSAVRHAAEAGHHDALLAYSEDLTAAWGDPSATRSVQWPVIVRAGTVAPDAAV